MLSRPKLFILLESWIDDNDTVTFFPSLLAEIFVDTAEFKASANIGVAKSDLGCRIESDARQ